MVETALLISVIGVVLAVWVPRFVRLLRTSKVAEASEQLAILHRAAAVYYEASHSTPHGVVRRCLPPAAGPTPPRPSTVPRDVDFASEAATGSPTWRALGYRPARPLRYRYTFVPTSAGCGLARDSQRPTLVTLRAEGDLDGDGELSLFEREITLDPEGRLVPLGGLFVRHRME